MNLNIIVELTKDIKKLHALEELIIDEEISNSHELRSRQALLISEVIQSLQQMQNDIKAETYAATEYNASFSRN